MQIYRDIIAELCKNIEMDRFQQKIILKDLSRKMVFLSGPRQAGKTTLAKALTKEFVRAIYINYDSDQDRLLFKEETWPKDIDLLVLDEVHKYKNWKNKVKGIYDTADARYKILVTGSARLNAFYKTGDSLAGRYFHHRLYPLSLKEVCQSQKLNPNAALEQFMNFGPFPEPFFTASHDEMRRWQKDYISQVLVEDVVKLVDIKDYSSLQLLVDRLRHCVGSPVSSASLAQDLEISPHTVKRYIEILEQMYLIFRVTPYHKNIARALLKEPKIYFFDSTLATDEGARLENLVALHLIKHLHFLEDTKGNLSRLHYIRNLEKKEIDFMYREDEKSPWHMVEVKTSDDSYPKTLELFQKQIQCSSAHQIVWKLSREKQYGDIKIKAISDFLMELSI